MAKTKFQAENADYSSACHLLARKLFYPNLFGVDQSMIQYDENTLLGESERGKILDGEMGIDRLIRCRVPGITGHTMFTIQERFRRPEFYEWQDVTITEWNHASGQPSELSKINAGIFVYGYANAPRASDVTDFLEVIAVNTVGLVHAITNGSISYDRGKNKKDQTFLGFGFNSLFERGLVMFHYEGPVVGRDGKKREMIYSFEKAFYR